MSPRENAYDRGRRLLQEGRLIVHHVDARTIEAVCRGDHGQLWRCGFGLNEWYCDCPARTTCAHQFALMLVTVKPGTDQRW